MRAPYPGELRICVIEFVEDGASRREAAEQYAVSPGQMGPTVSRGRDFPTDAARGKYFAA